MNVEQESESSIKTRDVLRSRTYSYDDILDAYCFGVKEGEIHGTPAAMCDREDLITFLRKKFKL